MTRAHGRSSSPRRTEKRAPSTQRYTWSTPERSRAMNASRSADQLSVSLVIAAADSPAEVPKNPARAGTRSLEDSPCRYRSGGTSATFVDAAIVHRRGLHPDGAGSRIRNFRSYLVGSTPVPVARGGALVGAVPRTSARRASRNSSMSVFPSTLIRSATSSQNTLARLAMSSRDLARPSRRPTVLPSPSGISSRRSTRINVERGAPPHEGQRSSGRYPTPVDQGG